MKTSRYGRRDFAVSALLVVLLLVGAGVALAQFPRLPKIPKKITEKIPRLSNLMKGQSPLTTKLGDAALDFPFFDDFNPEQVLPMGNLDREPDGSYVLRSGVFEFRAQSF